MDWIKQALEACAVDLEYARARSAEADKKEGEAHQVAVDAQARWEELRQAERALKQLTDESPRHEVPL